jgi:hypothetical protein
MLASSLDRLHAKRESELQIVVYNVNGTFDVSLLSTDGSVFKVLVTAGDMHLSKVYRGSRLQLQDQGRYKGD